MKVYYDAHIYISICRCFVHGMVMRLVTTGQVVLWSRMNYCLCGWLVSYRHVVGFVFNLVSEQEQ